MSKIKTFRGKLIDHTMDRISLQGGESDIGYRLVKFQVMGKDENQDYETTIQIFKTKPEFTTTKTQQVDFTDDTLLAACFYNDSTSGGEEAAQTIMFDKEVINQDLYITMDGSQTSNATINYYLEFEEVKMSNGEQAVVNFTAALLHGE